MHLRASLPGGLAVAMLALTPSLRADKISAIQMGTKTNTLGRHVTAATGPTGAFKLTALSHDKYGNPKTDDVHVKNGSYQADTSPVSTDSRVTGVNYEPHSHAEISWGPGFWDSSKSDAAVDHVGLQFRGEDAFAKAVVKDPADYHFAFDPAFAPEVRIEMTIVAGTTLTSLGSGLESSSASLSGFRETSLLDAPLWTYSWRADSAHPDSSTFLFLSNPLLGLDDAALTGEFRGLISDSGGVHTLLRDFTVSVIIPVDLPLGTETLDFTSGGEDDLDARASVVPEPSALGLTACGLLIASRLVRALGRPRASRGPARSRRHGFRGGATSLR
jgi:hypothetical protein